jgi:hypothetical protein
MWPIFAFANKFVAIFLAQDALSCYWIEKTDHGTAPLVLRAYKNYPLNNLELANLILFNPTVIKKHITSFLQEHNLEDAFVAFILDGPVIAEQFVAMPTSTPHRTDFSVAHSASVLWEYRYLYPNDDGQFVFYVYSVPRSLILQYKLLAIATQCNLITMTTQTMALLSAYQNVFGPAFRRSQLAVDMMRCNNNIAELVTADALRRMVSGTAAIKEVDTLLCAAAAGLFCSERIE